MLKTKQKTVKAPVTVEYYECDVCGNTFTPEYEVRRKDGDVFVSYMKDKTLPEGWRGVYSDAYGGDVAHICPDHALVEVLKSDDSN